MGSYIEFNKERFSILFSDLVKGIDTRNSNWKIYFKEIDWKLRTYLNNESFHGNLIDYELEIERVGQSIIKCTLCYIEAPFGKKGEIYVSQRVKREGTIGDCPKCGSTTVKRFIWFGMPIGCIQKNCDNYYKRYLKK